MVVRGVSGVDSVSRICIRMAYTGAPYFPTGREKNWPYNHHQIFRVCTGHKVWHNDFEGVWSGDFDGGRKTFGPHNSPRGGQGVLKFLCVTEAYRPHVQTKYWALQYKGECGGRPQRNFTFLGVAGDAEQISDPLGGSNVFFAPETSGVILPTNAGVNILIFAGVDESQPQSWPNFSKKNCQIFETFSPKNRHPPKLPSSETWFIRCYVEKCLLCLMSKRL